MLRNRAGRYRCYERVQCAELSPRMQAPQVTFNRALKPLSGAIEGLVEGCCVVFDSGGLAPLEVRLYDAAFVVQTALVSVLVAEMHVHPGDLPGISAKSAFHRAFDMGSEFLTTGNIAICIDLDLHWCPSG